MPSLAVASQKVPRRALNVTSNRVLLTIRGKSVSRASRRSCGVCHRRGSHVRSLLASSAPKNRKVMFQRVLGYWGESQRSKSSRGGRPNRKGLNTATTARHSCGLHGPRAYATPADNVTYGASAFSADIQTVRREFLRIGV